MEAAQAPAKRIAVGEVISQTFSIHGQNLGALLGSAIVVFVVIGLVAGILQSAGGLILILLAGALRLAGQALYVGFVVKLASTWIASIVSTTITAPIFAIAVTVLYYDLAGPATPDPVAPPPPPPPAPPAG